MRVLLSPGSFSTAVNAVLAAQAMTSGWRARSDDDVTSLPLCDGSAGMIDTVAASLGGELVSVAAPDPLGRAVPGTVLYLPGHSGAVSARGAGTAVIEAGQAIGTHLLDPAERQVGATEGTSEGVGRLLRAALDTGAGRIVVGVGPAGAHDGGAGMLRGLGLDAASLAWGGVGLAAVVAADLRGLADLRAELGQRDVVVACSTDDPLVGLHGAGASLVTRAGLAPGRAQDVDRAVGHFAELLDELTPPRRLLPLLGSSAPDEPAGRARSASRPYTGAGGGVGLVLGALGARLLDGAGVVADLVGLEAHVSRSDLVVTGCECLDADSARSGVVATVAASALRQGVPVVAVARDVETSRRELARIGIVGSYALRPRPGPFSPTAVGEASSASALVGRLAEMSGRMARTWSRT